MLITPNTTRERQRLARGPVTTLGFLAAMAMAILVSGCSSAQVSSSPAPSSQPALPAYVYPADPPLVGIEELRGLMIRLDARKTLIWAFNDSPACPSVAALLADRRDALRSEGVAIIGLFTGPAAEWQTRVVRMLRSAGANFPCAVLEAGREAPVGMWLFQRPSEPPAGIYVVGQNRRVVSRASEEEDSIRDCLDGLSGNPRLATRPTWLPASRPDALRDVRRAEIRLIEIAGGRTLAQAEGRGDDPERLARVLAGQLTAALPEPPRVAILPLRQSSRGQEQSPGLGLAVSEYLGLFLAAAGWPHLVQPQEAAQILASLDQTPLGAEFNPGSLQGQTPWQAVLVGTVSVEAVSGRP